VSFLVHSQLGVTPLHVSCCFGDDETVRFLLSKGADKEALDMARCQHSPYFLYDECTESKLGTLPQELNTPLHGAARFGNAGCIRILLDAGARLMAKNRAYFTALHKAAAHGNKNCVEVLLEYGADTNARTRVRDPTTSIPSTEDF
jgi:ankyrin repeat protein